MPNVASKAPEKGAVQRVASNALQSKAVSVDKLSGYLFRTYRLTTTKGFFYLLKCRPSQNVRLLRHEDDRLEMEAYVLQALRNQAGLVTARLIEYSNTNAAIGSRYEVTGPFGGCILADIEPSLSRQALANIDKSLGAHVQLLATVKGSVFGSLRQAQGSPGSQSWARVFASMLETILRDGEDALISLPYDGMRELVRKHRGSLDKVTQPSLVILELCADHNVVVDATNQRVSGLLDYSTAFWGDPFMSDCFYRPTASFAEGFGKLPNGDADERIRQYMYVLYHSLLAVIRHCYRPSEDHDEMEARRDLTTAMRQLMTVPAR
ncbi:hypothetical protein BAUCODRAFT_62836 [Baudoinia panamericana UAMH 10762]|uniref:Aminoglycoside phosphotransferase domain-containing protein n=1 Tax=Baudoinia panamericana (strain UAMH 10762) TaxID=717646 RepID=M2NKS1_BAUPA|nr:uncharacterized protein BAUCODRAFT_62836 [Baudoinia panamericana UAMH 10762]EMD00040.1 hypothetical protein BAUCODRAFT_62836 [Baudoinia panamericana UAMH 10762]